MRYKKQSYDEDVLVNNMLEEINSVSDTDDEELYRTKNAKKKSAPISIPVLNSLRKNVGSLESESISSSGSIETIHLKPSTTLVEKKDDNQEKREALLIFMLHHITLQYSPEPTVFIQLCKSLLQAGYISDARYLDLNFLKAQTRKFMLDVITKFPAHLGSCTPPERIGNAKNLRETVQESNRLKKSASMNSLLSEDKKPQSLGPRTSSLPFFNFLFWNQSRYKQDFRQATRIGKGGFGSVFRVVHRVDMHEYAIKKVKIQFRTVQELEVAYKKVTREVKSLAALNHKNVVSYNQAWFEPCYSDSSVTDSDTEDDNSSLADESKSPRRNLDFDDMEQFEMSDIDDDMSNKDIKQLAPPITFESMEEEEDINNIEESNTKEPEIQLPPSPIPTAPIQRNGFLQKKEPQMDSNKLTIREGNDWEALFKQLFNRKNRKFEMVLYIQMELCSPHTLEDWLWSSERVNGRVVNLKACRDIFFQFIKGLQHIHSKGIIHRDVKPSNIFIADDFTVKIGDFGLAVDLKQHENERRRGKHYGEHTAGVGTLTYASPEQLRGSKYDSKADIFSVGIILFELLHPFSTKSERAHVLMDVRKGKIPKESIQKYPLEMTLVQKCINNRPEDRPTASEILRCLKAFMRSEESTKKSKIQTPEKCINSMQDKDLIIEQQKQQILKLQQQLKQYQETIKRQQEIIQKLKNAK